MKGYIKRYFISRNENDEDDIKVKFLKSEKYQVELAEECKIFFEGMHNLRLISHVVVNIDPIRLDENIEENKCTEKKKIFSKSLSTIRHLFSSYDS